jgi:hypothetical protein
VGVGVPTEILKYNPGRPASILPMYVALRTILVRTYSYMYTVPRGRRPAAAMRARRRPAPPCAAETRGATTAACRAHRP